MSDQLCYMLLRHPPKGRKLAHAHTHSERDAGKDKQTWEMLAFGDLGGAHVEILYSSLATFSVGEIQSK